MSYILDALKRADAERERGSVPGLQSRHVPLLAVQTGRSAPYRIVLAAGALALALGGVAAGLWLWQKPTRTDQLLSVDAVVATPVPLAQPVSPPTTPRPASPPAGVRALPRAVPKPVRAAAAADRPAQPRPSPEPAKAAVTPAAPAAAPAVIPLLDQLPEDIRRQIPSLVITGSVYSENPKQRLLLVNKQVLHEGSLAAPEVKLEEIQARRSVLSFRGTRFLLAH